MLKKLVISSFFIMSSFSFTCNDSSIHSNITSLINNQVIIFSNGQVYIDSFAWHNWNGPAKKTVIFALQRYTKAHYPNFTNTEFYDLSSGRTIANIPYGSYSLNQIKIF